MHPPQGPTLLVPPPITWDLHFAISHVETGSTKWQILLSVGQSELRVAVTTVNGHLEDIKRQRPVQGSSLSWIYSYKALCPATPGYGWLCSCPLPEGGDSQSSSHPGPLHQFHHSVFHENDKWPQAMAEPLLASPGGNSTVWAFCSFPALWPSYLELA